MQPDYTHIAVVLDRSGSMGSIAAETIASFNAFLKEQRAVPGKATLTLNLFDHECEPIYNFIPLELVEDLTPQVYYARGRTALRDAIGRTIVETGERLAALNEAIRPGKVLLVIITDGYENASREFSAEQIAAMIKHQEEVYAWQVVYMGANQDAIAVGSQMNVGAGNAYNAVATGAGILMGMQSLSRSAVSYRTQQEGRVEKFWDSQAVQESAEALSGNV